MVARLFPDLITEAYTFNAAGFDPETANVARILLPPPFNMLLEGQKLTDEFIDLFSEFIPGTPAAGFSDITNYNLESEDIEEGNDSSLVASILTGAGGLGEETFVPTEGNSHLIEPFMDSLSMQSLFYSIDNSLTIDDMKNLYLAASDSVAETEETLLKALYKLFKKEEIILNTIDITDGFDVWLGIGDIEDRRIYYNKLLEVEQEIGGNQYTLEILGLTDSGNTFTSFSPTQIKELALGDIAYRYALVKLNPFAILGADYSEFNKNGELDLFSNETPEGQLSGQYLQDRAEMLSNLIVKNIYDGVNTSSIKFIDAATQVTVFNSDLNAPQKTIVFGSSEGEEIKGTNIPYRGDNFDDHLFGMGGNDTIWGYGGNDYIEGGQGQDTLNGGAGNDTFGIIGEDEAYDTFNGGDGIDTIKGSSGNDTIRVHNFVGEDTVEIIDGGGGDGDVIAGTEDSDTIDLSGTSLIGIKAVRGGGGEDTITGSAGDYADHLFGGEEGDTLRGLAGHDHLYGTMDDLSDDNAGDILEGGVGNDTYYVGAGDVVDDSDKMGTIIFNNKSLSALAFNRTAPDSDTYKTADGLYTAVKDGNGFLRLSTLVNGSVKSFSIANFTTDSALGITLKDYTPPGVDFDYTWSGSETQDISDVYEQSSNPGNYNIFMFSNGGVDTLHQVMGLGSSPRMKLNGLGGNDFLFGFADSDEIHGGSGNDLIRGHLNYMLHGSTTFEVFPGETIHGDTLYGDGGNDGIFGSMANDVLDGGADNDIISGYNGDDTIMGGTGMDILFGSAGSDTIEGGDGNDALFGYGAHQSLGFEDLVNPAWSLGYQNGYLGGCSINFSVYLNEYLNEAGNDTLSGGEGDDFLAGGGGSDNLYGGADQDSLSGGIGGDYLEGGSGNDLLFGDNGDNIETLNDGVDYLYGGSGNDYLYGMGGDDYLYGQENDDVLSGGSGNDFLFGDSGIDTLVGDLGDDTLYGGDDVDYLYGDNGDATGFGNDTLYGGRGNDFLYGHGGNDKLYGGDDVDELQGNLGDDTLYGGSGGDFLYGDNGVDGSGSGNDKLYGGTGNDELHGHGGKDELYGESDDDTLFGEDDDDILVGGYGSDNLIGGGGNNKYIFEVGHGAVGGGDFIFGEGGWNILDFQNISMSAIEVSVTAENNDLTIRYSAFDKVTIIDGAVNTNFSFVVGGGEYSYNAFLNAAAMVRTGTSGNDSIEGCDANESIYGGSGNDELYGKGGNDKLFGENGNDMLIGDEGDDQLVGGRQNDRLFGGLGNDRYLFSAGDNQDFVEDDLGANQIVIQTNDSDISIDFAGEDGGIVTKNEQGTGIWLQYGYANGSYRDGVFIANGRNNTSFSYNINGVNFNLADILARANITLNGDEGENILHGNNGHDKLYGGAGNDQLYGYAGRDILYGEDGDDILTGGTGGDALYGGNGNDMLVGGAGADYLDGGVGDDTVSYADETEDITVALWAVGKGGSAEGDTYKNIENIIGGKGNDHLSSYSQYCVIEGGMGADVLDGGWRWESTVSYRSSSAGVTVQLRNDGRYGRGYGGDAEGDLLDGFYNLVGSEHNDFLTLSDWYGTVKGLGGNDILQGGEDGDTLDGGKGDDLLQGGKDDDTYLFNRGDGTDTIYDTAGYYAQVEVFDRFGHHSTTETWVDLPWVSRRDRIVFGEGISLDDLFLYRDPGNESAFLGDDDLVIALKDSDNPDASWDELSDKIIIKNFFYHEVKPEVNIFVTQTGLTGVGLDNYYGEYVNSIERFLLDDNRNAWWGDFIDEIVAKSCGTDGNDRIEMLQYSDTSVRWEGLGGNDLLVGALGDDVLLGGEGDDRLDGRGGFNYLDGGAGNDTYVITNRNSPIEVFPWGIPADLPIVRDLISDSDGIDRILFLNDIAREDIVFTLSANGDLIIDYGLYQQHQAVIAGNSVETFEMSDGSTINREQVVAALTRIADLSGKDVHEISNTDIVNNIQLKSELYNSWSDQFVEHHGHDDWNIFDGNSDNEIVYGGAGVDELRGHAGNDELHGGASDDLLNGGNGSDIYVFGRNDRNDDILDMEFPFMADSYGNYQIDDGVYEHLLTWKAIFEVHPNEAPSNDTLLLAGDINKVDLEIFWATQNDSPENLSDDLLIRIKPNDSSSTWDSREDNIDTIVNYFNANPLQESILNPETGEYEEVARILTESDLSGYSDKALRHLAYEVVDGVDGIRNTTSFQNVVSFMETENDKVDFNREYRNREDTILIEQYYNRDRTIENITLGVTGYTLTNNDIMDLMSTDNSEMIRGVDWTANTIHAKGGNDIVVGGSQNDTLYGDAGNDRLDGGTGADKMFGGTGDDTYIVDDSSDIVSEKIDEGIDTVESGVTFRLGNNIENLTLTGTDAINGTGNSLNNLLVGNSAANVLTGGAGADTMLGGLGNDSYYVDNELDVVMEEVDAGTDTVRSTVSYGLGDNIENLILTGAAAISGTGNVLNNILKGNSEANVLSGLDGDDRLYGNAGDDTLLGGTGNDVLNGGIGSDTMLGGLGDDSYYVDNELDVVMEEVDAGTDTVRSTVSYGLGDNIENLILTGEAAISGTGNVLNNILKGNSEANVLSGLDGDDRLYGNAGDDTLLGGTGNDVLNGDIGSDTMLGGLGDDSYYVDNELDVVTEEAAAGTDTVRSTVSYGLGDNIENLILTGAAAISGTGNVLNNILKGNSEANVLSGLDGDDRLYGNAGDDTLLGGTGNDVLNGGIGSDTMLGGLGDDSYYVDNELDVVMEEVDAGTDTVRSTVSYGLGDNIENLILTGAAAISGTGNVLNNILKGNSEANVLSGLDGDDRLYGNAGDDTLLGGTGNDILNGGIGSDIFVFDTALDAATNKDRIIDFESGNDKINLDKSIFTALSDEGMLSSEYFQSNTIGVAGDENDYILYNTTSGALLYDADGNGQGVAVQFATLTTRPEITSNDFLVSA